MKRFLAILALVAMLFGGCFAEEFEDCDVLYVVCNPKSYVNIRDFPSKKQPATGTLYYGDKVYADGETKNGYVHLVNVSNEMGEGWVYHSYLDIWEPMGGAEGEYQVVADGRVAIRKCIDGEVVGWLKPGQVVNVLGMTAEWAIIKRGFVKTEYLEEVADEKK